MSNGFATQSCHFTGTEKSINTKTSPIFVELTSAQQNYIRISWASCYLNRTIKVKGKSKLFPLQTIPLPTQRVGRGIALLFHDRGTRGGWVVSSTPRPHFTPRERPGTHFRGGWVGSRAGLDGRKISSRPGLDPGPSSPQSVAIPTELPGPQLWKVETEMYLLASVKCDLIRTQIHCHLLSFSAHLSLRIVFQSGWRM